MQPMWHKDCGHSHHVVKPMRVTPCMLALLLSLRSGAWKKATSMKPACFRPALGSVHQAASTAAWLCAGDCSVLASQPAVYISKECKPP